MANPRREEAVEAINTHLRDYGPVGWERVASKFHDVPKATLWRWIKEVREKVSKTPTRQKLKAANKRVQRIVEDVRAAGGSLPATPSPAYLAENGAEGEANINFLGSFQQLYREAEKLRDYSLNADGNIRIPLYFQNSINLRRNLLQNYLEVFQQVYDVKRMEAFYESIIEEIGKVSPDVQKAVVERLHRLDRDRGITING